MSATLAHIPLTRCRGCGADAVWTGRNVHGHARRYCNYCAGEALGSQDSVVLALIDQPDDRGAA